MMLKLNLQYPAYKGNVALPASKSLCNRALIINALGGGPLENISPANDSQTLQKLLEQYHKQPHNIIYDAGAGGTTYRFMLAFLATHPGKQILTGSKRMKQRPVEPLVNALRQIGANIQYLERQGYPPLSIGPFSESPKNEVCLSANVSSQFLSALLLVSPKLKNGLRIHSPGQIVSRPYLDMTLKLMNFYGVKVQEKKDTFLVKAKQRYNNTPYRIEPDWSAASYFYALAALANKADLWIPGLTENSLQGDAVLSEWMTSWGVETRFENGGIRLLRRPEIPRQPPKEMDFYYQPDLAQTFALLSSILGHPLRLHGLQTLRIKETDRIAALQTELAKVKVTAKVLGPKNNPSLYVSGRAHWNSPPVFDTYDDHRMAMSLALLATQGTIYLKEPKVVNKSFPDFWTQLTATTNI